LEMEGGEVDTYLCQFPVVLSTVDTSISGTL